MAKPVPPEPAVRLAEAERQLAEALLAGQDTRPIRTTIDGLERAIAAQADAQAAERAPVEQAEQQAITERAHEIASAAASRFASTVSGLEPPPSPWLPTEGEQHRVIH